MNNRDGIANGQGQKGNVECSLLYNVCQLSYSLSSPSHAAWLPSGLPWRLQSPLNLQRRIFSENFLLKWLICLLPSIILLLTFFYQPIHADIPSRFQRAPGVQQSSDASGQKEKKLCWVCFHLWYYVIFRSLIHPESQTWKWRLFQWWWSRSHPSGCHRVPSYCMWSSYNTSLYAGHGDGHYETSQGMGGVLAEWLSEVLGLEAYVWSFGSTFLILTRDYSPDHLRGVEFGSRDCQSGSGIVQRHRYAGTLCMYFITLRRLCDCVLNVDCLSLVSKPKKLCQGLGSTLATLWWEFIYKHRKNNGLILFADLWIACQPGPYAS